MSQSQRPNVAFFHPQEKCVETVYLFETEFNSKLLLLVLKWQDARFRLFNGMQKDSIIVHY